MHQDVEDLEWKHVHAVNVEENRNNDRIDNRYHNWFIPNLDI